jgi:RNA polymerase sigma factor (sigma-70 family)
MSNIIYIKKNQKVLIELLCKNDNVAQRQLFERYEKKLLAVCFRYLRNEEEALDALNRSFLKIFEKVHQYKAEAKFETWLQRITINTCLDFIKSQKSYKKNFIQTNEFSLYGEVDTQHSDLEGWWEAAIAIPAEVLYQLIKELPLATRTVFNLYVIDGITHVQIAVQLKISKGTSKWHLSNARKILKEKISIMLSNKNFNDGTKEAKNN